MKIRTRFFVAMLAAATLTAQAQWRDNGVIPAQPLINVSGNAEVKVAPDEVDLSTTIETHQRNLDEARAENDRKMHEILAFLHQQGVKAKDIQTDFINIQPVFTNNHPVYYSFMSEALPDRVDARPDYYTVAKGLKVKLTDMSGFDTVLAGLLTNGVNHVEGIDFQTTQLRKYKDQARAMAIRAAREKAEAMAGELGVKVGRPYTINVTESGGSYNWYWGGSYRGYGGGRMAIQNSVANAGGPGDSGGSLAPGQISVSATVEVSFLIQ